MTVNSKMQLTDKKVIDIVTDIKYTYSTMTFEIKDYENFLKENENNSAN